jgi:hypothetical protein
MKSGLFSLLVFILIAYLVIKFVIPALKLAPLPVSKPFEKKPIKIPVSAL